MEPGKLPEYCTIWLSQGIGYVEGYDFQGAKTKLAWRVDCPDNQTPGELEAEILEKWDGIRQRLIARLGDGTIAKRGRIILGEDLRHTKASEKAASLGALTGPKSGGQPGAGPLVWAVVELADRAMAHTELMADLTAGSWDDDRAARIDSIEAAHAAKAAATIEAERSRWDAGEWLALVSGAVELLAPVLPAAKGALGKVAQNAKRLKGLFTSREADQLTDNRSTE
jgi:hypothetical protein